MVHDVFNSQKLGKNSLFFLYKRKLSFLFVTFPTTSSLASKWSMCFKLTEIIASFFLSSPLLITIILWWKNNYVCNVNESNDFFMIWFTYTLIPPWLNNNKETWKRWNFNNLWISITLTYWVRLHYCLRCKKHQNHAHECDL